MLLHRSRASAGPASLVRIVIPRRNGANVDGELSDGQVPLDITQTAKGVRLDRNGATSQSATGAMAFLVLVSSGMVFLA
jgi:hypothetical protein